MMKLMSKLLGQDSKPAGNLNNPTRVLGLTTMLMPIMGGGPAWQVSLAPATRPLPQPVAVQRLSGDPFERMR